MTATAKILSGELQFPKVRDWVSLMRKRPRLLILGATGRLGSVFAAKVGAQFDGLTPTHSALDLSHSTLFEKALKRLEFDMALNVAGLTNPDDCEENPALAMRINAESPGILASACAQRGARLVHLSTDYVFAGQGAVFLEEEAPVSPVNQYGHSKRAGEMAVLEACPSALVGRVSWLFGKGGSDVPQAVLKRAKEGQPLGFIEDKWSVPTSTADLAEWLARLLTDLSDVSGVLHLCNTGCATWRDYAQVSLDLAYRHGLLEKAQTTYGLRLNDFPQFKARRPAFTVMSNARLAFLLKETPRSWQAALEDHFVSLAAAV